jgi:uncharacterized protein (TIGR02300 family)
MSTASELSKAMRGTKRVCQACEVRFYDLSRDPIVCPSCGAQYTPAAVPVVATRVAPMGGKTGWRNNGFKRPEPVIPEADPEPAETPAVASADDVADEPASAAVEDDVILEQEPDDGSVSGLVDHDLEDPKER